MLYKCGNACYKPSNYTVTNHTVLALFLFRFLVFRFAKISSKLGLDCGMETCPKIDLCKPATCHSRVIKLATVSRLDLCLLVMRRERNSIHREIPGSSSYFVDTKVKPD